MILLRLVVGDNGEEGEEGERRRLFAGWRNLDSKERLKKTSSCEPKNGTREGQANVKVFFGREAELGQR